MRPAQWIPVALAACFVVLLGPVSLPLLLAALLLITRPWDANPNRTQACEKAPPWGIFLLVSWVFWAADQIAALKPAVFRVPEIAAAYVRSQVLFTVTSLGIPDILRQRGPLTAPDIAALLGPAARADWVDRLMLTAISFGLFKRLRPPPARARTALGSGGNLSGAAAAPNWAAGSEGQRRGVGDLEAARRDQQRPAAENRLHHTNKPLCAPTAAQQGQPQPSGWAFDLNATSALLCSDAPWGMQNFVLLMADNAAALSRLGEGVRTGTVPFALAYPNTGGFWGRLAAEPRLGAVFDGAMREKAAMNNAAVVEGYNWGRFDHVLDVAGGNGQLLAVLMHRHPALQGTLVDRPSQIERAKQWWAREHREALPRVSFAPGDLFDASSLPPPPRVAAGHGGGGRVAYVLSDILHDWDDTEACAILRVLRSCVSIGTAAATPTPTFATGLPASTSAAVATAPPLATAATAFPGAPAAASRLRSNAAAAQPAGPAVPPLAVGSEAQVSLILIETTLSESIMPCLLPHRRTSDLIMLSNFGGAERDEKQLGALLAKAGWALRRVVPTTGLMCVVEAVPV